MDTPPPAAQAAPSVPPAPAAGPAPTAPRRRRWLLWLAIGLPLLIAVGGLGAVQGREWIRRSREDADYAKAQRCLAEGKKNEASLIISLRLGRVAGGAGGRDERVSRWYRLDIECALKMGNVPRLAQLYERVPDLIIENEDASARVAMTMLVVEEFEQFRALRDAWRGREKTATWWLAVDVEAAMRQGRREEAIALLQTRLPGREDSVRLIRLALLHADQDPAAALRYLDEAFTADPKNADVRTLRALQLERAGDLALARQEFAAALLIEPDNAGRADALAEFYRRNRDLTSMVRTLAAAQRPHGPEVLRFKLDFWSRVAFPGDPARVETERGELVELVRFIEALPAGVFWDEAAFMRLSVADAYQRRHPEVHWLRLLQLLKQGREADALDLATTSPFRERPVDADLDSALLQTLRLRVRDERSAPINEALLKPNRHPLFLALERLVRGGSDPDLVAAERVLRGPHAFAALAIAAGWNEAGLVLMPDFGVLPADSPSWLAYGVTTALRANRGMEQALEYAARQPPSSDLAIQRAEMLIALKRRPEAVALLEPVRADPAVGALAAWMLAGLALEDRDADRAEAILDAHPDLAGNLRGRELRARAMVVRDRNQDADRLYGEIGEQSPEAALWLARRAKARDDDVEAQRWTAVLVKLQPAILDNPQAPPPERAAQPAQPR